jgi:hypothetical protein
MNIVSSHILIPYTRCGYPTVTEATDIPAPYEHQWFRFDSSRFSKGFRDNPFTFNMDKSAELYNKKKQMEPLAMQLIGTTIDLYA